MSVLHSFCVAIVMEDPSLWWWLPLIVNILAKTIVVTLEDLMNTRRDLTQETQLHNWFSACDMNFCCH